MTDTVSNMILDKNGDHELTVHTTKVEEKFAKTLITITPPQSTANWTVGPKDTLIVDLLRIEKRLEVSGYVDVANKDVLNAISDAGGTFLVSWDGFEFNAILEKGQVSKDENENDEREVKFSLLRGKNYGDN